MAEEFEKLPANEAPTDHAPAEEASQTAAPEGRDPARRPGSELFEWLQMVLGCVLAAVLLFNCLIRLTRVQGDSMNSTLQEGELMLVWSLGYTPEQGDIVVLNKTTAEFLGGEGGKAIVKRVIATGGQTVDIDYDANTVYVDGAAMDEPYINAAMYRPRDAYMQQTHWEVPEGQVFVLGDNRNDSTDSRHQLLGCIDHDYILGKVVLAIWPPEKFGPL